MTLPPTLNETLNWLRPLRPLPILMQESFWWWQCSGRYCRPLTPTSWNLGPCQYLFGDNWELNKVNQPAKHQNTSSPAYSHVGECILALDLHMVGWLNSFNAELSPTRYWRGPISQDVGEERDYAWHNCHHQNDFCIKMGSQMTLAVRRAAMRGIRMFY